MQFLCNCLQPIITGIEEELNRKIFRADENVCVDLDEDYILRTDKNSTASYYSTLVAGGIISVNEARKALNYPAVEGGDKLVVAYTDVAKGTVNGGAAGADDGEE